MKTVAIAGTFDSKGKEYAYVRELMQGLGLKTLMIHTGTFAPEFPPDISNAEVAAAAGADIADIARGKDRAVATAALASGMESLLPRLYREGRFHGVLAFGGSGGTSLVAPGMRALPVGVPKIIVSTMAGGDVSVYVGSSDIIMFPSVVDVAGLNSISVRIMSNAAFAMAGMLNFENTHPVEHKPLIAATMFGVTTPCVDEARRLTEEQGFEVLTFHATGAGGKAMEALVEQGYITGMLDLTTTEWCDELFGGVLAAGPRRLEAAAQKGIPQVVSVGALDMVNFGEYASVPAAYAGRTLYKHNPTVTLMRTTAQENRRLGQVIAEKLNMSTGPTALLLPLRGLSMLDAPGQAFHDPEADTALFDALRRAIDPAHVELIEVDAHINDPHFATVAVNKLMEYMHTSDCIRRKHP